MLEEDQAQQRVIAQYKKDNARPDKQRVGRPTLRTEFLMPAYKSAMNRWMLSLTLAARNFGWLDKGLTLADCRRILEGRQASVGEVALLSKTLYEYGKEHNLPEWQGLKP